MVDSGRSLQFRFLKWPLIGGAGRSDSTIFGGFWSHGGYPQVIQVIQVMDDHEWSWLSIETYGDLGISHFKNPLQMGGMWVTFSAFGDLLTAWNRSKIDHDFNVDPFHLNLVGSRNEHGNRHQKLQHLYTEQACSVVLWWFTVANSQEFLWTCCPTKICSNTMPYLFESFWSFLTIPLHNLERGQTRYEVNLCNLSEVN